MTAEVTSSPARCACPTPAVGDIEVLCSWCRRVRGGDGVWLSVDFDPSRDRFGHFTHGICPTCLDEHFRELARMMANSSPDLPDRSSSAPRS